METFELDSFLNDSKVNVESGPTKCYLCRLNSKGRAIELRIKEPFIESYMMHICFNCVPNNQPERSKREDHNFWEAEEYDGKRPWHFKVFSNEEEAKKWVSQNPQIRKCRPLILDAVL